MNDKKFDTPHRELQDISFKVREHIIRMSANGGCFIGASLSCVELIVFLYRKFLNINLLNLQSKERDYFFLSKGHDVPTLYGTFAEIGFIEKERLKNHLSVNDNIYWHPNRKIPGIEFHSGSLGHLLSVAIGVAYDCKIKSGKNKIVVLLGDGELNEGSIWEAALIASALKLDNLMAVIDRNQFQANVKTEELIPLEPLERKFEAFGWAVQTCNGHDFCSLEETFSEFPFETNRPTVIIADTVRGKGLPSIEGRADRWFCNFSENEVAGLLNELHTNIQTELDSEIMVVR